jgi:hypothetical protein
MANTYLRYGLELTRHVTSGDQLWLGHTSLSVYARAISLPLSQRSGVKSWIAMSAISPQLSK